MNLLDIETFNDTFGKNSKKRKPKLNSYNINKIIENVEENNKK